MTKLEWILAWNASFLTGISIFIFGRYAMTRHMLHIVMVASSYVEVVCLLSASMIWHIFVGEHSRLFILLSIGAFLQGDFGVILMLKDKKKGRT